MKEIKHHLTQSLLMGYSAGTLPEAFNVVVATHISMCDECRAALGEMDAVGGEVLMAAGDAALSDDSLAATLEKIANTPAAPKVAARTKGIFPAPLQDYVRGDVEAVKWRRVGGGVRQMVLPTSRGATVRLLHIPAGSEVPDHGHRGTELTLVLQGAFRDDTVSGRHPCPGRGGAPARSGRPRPQGGGPQGRRGRAGGGGTGALRPG